MTDKALIRKIIRESISNLSGSFRESCSEIICNKLISLSEYKNASTISVYLSFDNEVDTAKIIENAFEENKRVFVPYIDGKIMYMVEIDKDTEYTLNKFGIQEPVFAQKKIWYGKLDLIILPLTGFDRKLQRLGKGGGYYDKFLSENNAVKAGLAYSVQEIDKLPIDPHDIPLDIVITEKEILR